MPTIVSLKPAQLENRLDADYYGPGFLANHDRLVRSGIRTARLRSLVKLGRRAVYFSTDTMPADEAPESWIPFLTADDLSDDGCSINLDAKRRVSPDFAAEYPNGHLRGNELLVKVKGPNQTTAYNSHKPDLEVLVSGTIWGALVDLASVDPHFLVAVLTSPYGANARTRLRTNTNVEFLAPDDLLGVLLPWPNERLLQRYIGDKLRQAEGLRKHARTLEAQIESKFAPLTSNLLTTKKAWRVARADVDPYRINAPHYDAVVFDMLAQARAIMPLASLRSLVGTRGITGGATPLGADYPPDGVFFVRVQNVKPYRLDLSDSAYIDGVADDELRRSRCAEKDVILTITGYPGTASIVMFDDLPLNINQHSARFDIVGDLTPEFVAAALNSPFLKKQVDRLAIGGTREALDYKSVGDLQIPVLPESDRNSICAWVNTSNHCIRAASRLTTAAKLLVEALIDGKVTDAELATAQDALERGINSADHAMLRRLTAGGLDVHGQPPLFPDLDILYALLAQTKEAVQ